MLTLKNLTIGYKGKTVAENINATLKEGELVCLVGRNGAGKSTLMRTITALQPPIKGSIWIKENHNDETEREVRKTDVARNIGIVLTEKTEVENLSVHDMVAMGRMPYTGFFGKLTAKDETIVQQAMSKLNITEFSQRMVSTLSDGERQKVMIAKTLAQQTPIILLDEPTAFLDYPSKTDTMLLLQQLAHEQNMAILISTHDLDIALRYCDRVWHLNDSTLDTSITKATPEMFL